MVWWVDGPRSLARSFKKQKGRYERMYGWVCGGDDDDDCVNFQLMVAVTHGNNKKFYTRSLARVAYHLVSVDNTYLYFTTLTGPLARNLLHSCY